jgi:flagellar motor switch protein FliN
MSDSNPVASSPGLQPFLAAWAESLAQVLEQISSKAQPCAVLAEPTAGSPAGSAADLWILGALSGGLRGELCLRLPPASALRLAQILMSEPLAPEAELTSDHREAALELVRQIGGLVVSSLKPRWGDVQLRLDAASGAPSWPSSTTSWLHSGDDTSGALTIELHLSAALAAALRAEAVETPEKTEPAPATASANPLPASAPEPACDSGSNVKLDLLMNVDLEVVLRFGSKRLLLREILDLNPGAVIELDRQVQEPIDLLLDGRLLARGEVVVMNGNYGLRVTEVAPANPD